ncbi:MAG TPA: TIGR02391 family protein [Acetobacteraceae bacterium]|nr:TIGR02391 family protein [Acetobacteraceae bacterium]
MIATISRLSTPDMETLFSIYPEVRDLLGTSPEDLAPVLLKLARGMVQNGMFHKGAVGNVALDPPNASLNQQRYPFHDRQQIEALLSRAWSWIERNDLITPSVGINGQNGWMIITPKGEQVSDAQDIQRIREAADFPKWLIHPSISEKVWRTLMRGDLDEAVFAAFKAVEEAVRSAGEYTAADIGVPLMRKAFDKNTGPLSEQSHPEGERDALAHLFAGAIGSHKNPHSHRTVSLTDIREAQEQVIIASHLLRIVDARRKPKP